MDYGKLEKSLMYLIFGRKYFKIMRFFTFLRPPYSSEELKHDRKKVWAY